MAIDGKDERSYEESSSELELEDDEESDMESLPCGRFTGKYFSTSSFRVLS